jgi:phenolic acid decarboxylase
MPKYRLLTADELHVLKKEFIDFLVVNGIAANDWEKIKKEDISKAEKTIELFSDVVLEGSLRKIKYLKKIEKTTMYFFRFDEEEAHLILLEQNQETQQVKKSSKKYQKSREEELFKMLNSGCEIDEKELFEQF